MSSAVARTLLWPSSSRYFFAEVPNWLEERLRACFPELRIVVARKEEQFDQEVPHCEILISWRLSAEQLARARHLRWIHCPATGLDQLLIPELVVSDVVVTNAAPVHALPVAEHAFAMMLALARRLPDSFRYQAERHWGRAESWQPERVPTEINGRTLGLVGLGAIGSEVARRAKAFAMRVVAVRRDPSRGAGAADAVFPPAQLRAMLAEADWAVIAAPQTPLTRNLIAAPELAVMKPSAFLVNVARGSLVDTRALTEALQHRRIAGAALDVTDPEPLPPDHPLWTLPNVLITPHLGGATDRFWHRQANLLEENLRRYLARQPLLYLVDKSQGY